MKSIIQSNIERRVQAEAEKKTLIDTYGNLIGWMKVLADWLLAPAGAILDGLVMFGIFFLSVKNMPLAIVLAAISAIVIQVLYGMPASHAASTAFTGRYQKEGEQKLMWGMWLLTIVGLGCSLVLSLRSDRLVIAVAEQHYQEEADTSIQARYDALLQQAQQQHNTDVATLQQRINTLQQDKIMWKGQLTTRERSSRKATALSEELTTLQQAYNTRIAQIEQQRDNSLQQLQRRNNNVQQLFATRVEDGGRTLKGINVAFNVVRLCIILLFMYFVAKAAEEVTTPATPVATTVVASNNNTVQQRPAGPDLAPAIASQPEPSRTVVKPFSTVLPQAKEQYSPQPARPIGTDYNMQQQALTPVATTVVADSTTPSGNTYNVTVVDGEPTLPPPPMMSRDQPMTLGDVRRYKGTYKGRTSDNARQIYRELLKMEAILEQEKNKSWNGMN